MSRDVERPYAEVPRVGDRVFLGDSTDDPYLQRRYVMSAQPDDDGVVSLRFSSDAVNHDPTPLIESLSRAGFVFLDRWPEHPLPDRWTDGVPAARQQASAPEVGVTVDRDVLAQGEPWFDDGELTGWCASPAFLVVSQDTDGAAEALNAAGQRFALVNERGHEVAREEADHEGMYTPNWISDVYLTDSGPAIYVDTKGDLPRLMGQRMVEILVEELTARSVPARVTVPPQVQPAMRVWNQPTEPVQRWRSRPDRAPAVMGDCDCDFLELTRPADSDLAVVAAILDVGHLVPVVRPAVSTALARDTKIDETPRQALADCRPPSVPGHDATMPSEVVAAP
jgi:hypothetical protein